MKKTAPEYSINENTFEGLSFLEKENIEPILITYNGKQRYALMLPDNNKVLEKIKKHGLHVAYFIYSIEPSAALTRPAKEKNYLRIIDLDGEHDFLFTTITHFISLGNNTVIYFNNRDYFLVTKTLLVVEEQLPSYWFKRIGRGVTINRSAINTEIIYDGCMVDLLNIVKRFSVTRRRKSGYIIWLELPLPTNLPLTA